MIVNLFIIFSYSAQQPLFVVMGCALVLVQYLAHKTIILRYCKQMPFEKGELNDKILSLLSIALFIRCIFAAWCYTCPEMFGKSLFEHTNMWSYKVTEVPALERFL